MTLQRRQQRKTRFCVFCALKTARDGSTIARHVGIRVGVPIPSTALSVNRLCGSGFQAIVTGAQVEFIKYDTYGYLLKRS